MPPTIIAAVFMTGLLMPSIALFLHNLTTTKPNG